MAKIVHDHRKLKLVRSGSTKYPWDEWFNGLVWELTPGEDFSCKITTFCDGVHKEMRRRNKERSQQQMPPQYFSARLTTNGKVIIGPRDLIGIKVDNQD